MKRPEEEGVVLLVEDDAALQDALAKFLELHGFTAIRAATADEAIAAIRTRRLAAAIVDLHLAQGTGRDVVVAIPQPIPVIIFSGAPEASCQLERLRPHTRLIQKPYSLLLLIDALQDMLAPAVL
jgi:DNA-binding response OmpR family regulator